MMGARGANLLRDLTATGPKPLAWKRQVSGDHPDWQSPDLCDGPRTACTSQALEKRVTKIDNPSPESRDFASATGAEGRRAGLRTDHPRDSNVSSSDLIDYFQNKEKDHHWRFFVPEK